MKKTLKKTCFIILSLASIASFAVVVTFLFKNVICLNGLRSYKINKTEIPSWIKKKVNKELEQFEQIDKSTFGAFDKLILENKVQHLAHFKISKNKVSELLKINLVDIKN